VYAYHLAYVRRTNESDVQLQFTIWATRPHDMTPSACPTVKSQDMTCWTDVLCWTNPWYHEYDGGRSFSTILGHLPATWSEPVFLHHVYGGIYWAATGKGFKSK